MYGQKLQIYGIAQTKQNMQAIFLSELCLSKHIGSGNMLERTNVLRIFIKYEYIKLCVIYSYYALQFARHSSIHFAYLGLCLLVS